MREKLKLTRTPFIIFISFILIAALASGIYFSSNGLFPNYGHETGLKKSSSGIGEKKIRLRFLNWDSSEKFTREKLEKAIKAFTDKHPNIEIDNITIPFYEYQEQLIRQTSDGNDPDLIQLYGSQPSILANKGVLEPMDVHFDKVKSLDFLSNGILSTCKYKGTLYSIPFSLNPLGLWYNKNLLKRAGIKEPPKTLEELTSQLEIIKKELPDVYGIGIDTTRTDYSMMSIWPIFVSFGTGSSMMDPQNPEFSSRNAVEAFKWLKTVVNGKYTPEGVKTNVLRENMAKEQIVFKIDEPGLRGIIQSLRMEFKGNLFDRAFSVVPVPSSGGAAAFNVANTYSLGITGRSSYKDEALEFIKYITGDEGSVKNYIVSSGYIPSLRSSIDNNLVELDNPTTYRFLSDIIPASRYMTYSPKFIESSMIVLDGMQKIFSGADLADTCSAIDAHLRQLSNE